MTVFFNWELRVWIFPVIAAVVSTLVVIRRIYFHPLSDIPGPRLAAATSLYAAYYEVLKDGAFVDHIKQLHLKYGVLQFLSSFIDSKLTYITRPNRSDCS